MPGRQILELALLDFELGVDDFLDLRQKPAIDPGVRVDFVERHPIASASRHTRVARRAIRQLVGDGVRVDGLEIETIDAGLQPAQRLLQRFLKVRRWPSLRRPTSSVSVSRSSACLNFRKRSAALGDHVVDRRLERGGVWPPVMSFFNSSSVYQPPAWPRPSRSEAGRLDASAEERDTRDSSRSRSSPVIGLIANWTLEPPVSTPTPQDRDRRVAHDLIFLVGERLRRRDGDRVAGMHAHRIQVSIEQTMMQLSFLSRTTSISNSFQPRSDSSIKTRAW